MVSIFILLLFFISTSLFTYHIFLLLGESSFSFELNLKKKKVTSAKESSESIEDIFLFMTPQQYRIFQVASIVILFLATFLVARSLSIALIVGAFGFFVPKKFLRYLIKKRSKDFEVQLPDVLTTLSSALRAGFTVTQALDMLVKEYTPPASQEFGIVLQENKLGVTLDDAFLNLTKRIKCESLELVVTATIISRALGGNLAEIFDRIEKTVRRKERIDGKIKALTAQGKMQGFVVGLAPVFLGGILYLMDPGFILPLFTTTIGQIAVVAMVIMELFGAIAISKIIKVEF